MNLLIRCKSLTRSGAFGVNGGTPRMALAVVCITLALVVSGCGAQASSAGVEPLPEVSVANVLSKQVKQWDDFTGRVVAAETVELRPRVSGYVQRVAYKEGQEVRKGDLLFVIDPWPYHAALDRVQADLARVRSEAQLAQAQYTRARALIEAKAISREEFETRKAATSGTHAGVQAAEAAVAAAQLDLQFTQVRSPINGRAGRAMATTGNLAQADTTLLTIVVSQDPVHVYFESDEQSFLRYAELARKGERTDTHNPVRVGLANEAGYPHEGTVDFVDNQVDPRTGTIRARAVLRNPDRVFTPGLFARVQLEGSSEFKAMLIDDKSVLTDQDRKYVYVLGSKNAAVRKDVVLGRSIDGLSVVESGLTPTDQVIVQGVQKVIAPGELVEPKQIAMDARARGDSNATSTK